MGTDLFPVRLEELDQASLELAERLDGLEEAVAVIRRAPRWSARLADHCVRTRPPCETGGACVLVQSQPGTSRVPSAGGQRTR